MINNAILPWQTTQHHQLERRWLSRSFPHALLFSGNSGLGKKQFAEAISAAVLCHHSDERLLACGECQSCLLLKAGNHPDYFLLSPEGKSQQIKVDQTREVSTILQQTAQLNHYQVVLIEQADRMNLAASNALLKTLEEPSANSLIVLVSSRPAKLLPTIKSRCQSLVFTVPDESVSLQWLREQSVSEAEPLLKLATGSPLLVLEYSETGELAYQKQWLSAWYDLSLRKQPLAAFVKEYSDDILRQLKSIARFLSDIIRFKMTGQFSGLVLQHKEPVLTKLAEACSLVGLFDLLDHVQKKMAECERIAGLNGQLVLESILIEWMRGLARR